MIRQAQITDLQPVQRLIFRASQLVFADALQTSDECLQQATFKKMYEQSQTKFSYPNILVYEQANQVVGCIVSYPAAKEAAYNQQMQAIVANGYRFAQEAIADTYYIDSLAVDPAYEGRGIAKQLIQAVVATSELPLSLLVEAAKPDVKAYYERLGFDAKPAKIFFGQEMYPMIKQKK